MVDEYQDTNPAQLELLQHLGERAPQRLRGGRRRPVHLPLARRRGAQHPRLRALLPRRQGGARWSRTTARTAGDPRRGQRGHREEPRAARQAHVDRSRRAARWSRVVTAPSEEEEARFVAGEVKKRHRPGHPAATRSPCSTAPTASRAPSRSRCARSGISYEVVGGSEFFDRREVKDVHRLLQGDRQPDGRGVAVAHRQRAGARHRRRHHGAAAPPGRSPTSVPLWEALKRAREVADLPAGRGRQGAATSCALIDRYRALFNKGNLAEVTQQAARGDRASRGRARASAAPSRRAIARLHARRPGAPVARQPSRSARARRPACSPT